MNERLCLIQTVKLFLITGLSFLILKISFLTLHQINPIFGYRVKITPDIKPINGLMDLSWWLQKGMTIVCRSYVIGHKFINPTEECGVQYPPDINTICGSMGRPCLEVSNNIWHLYVSLMLLEIDLLTLSMGVGWAQ